MDECSVCLLQSVALLVLIAVNINLLPVTAALHEMHCAIRGGVLTGNLCLLPVLVLICGHIVHCI